MEDSEIEEEINQMDLSVGRQTKYTTEQSGYPIWKNTMPKYYPVGELMFEDMITELKKAEHFIFMEFFDFFYKNSCSSKGYFFNY